MEKMTVLLSTYNGEMYLEALLASLTTQIFPISTILVRDDSSTDGTCDILTKWQNSNLLKWYSGDNLGPARSFRDLICKAPDSDYYAFCDQDDVWMSDKLSVATDALKPYDDIPAMYCGAYQMTDSSLSPIYTKPFVPIIDIYHAVIENVATGCTVVFNRKLMEVIRAYNPEFCIMHDEWLYKVCVAIGGKVIYDKTPHIYYRQHGNNVIGGINDSFANRILTRFRKMFSTSTHYRRRVISEILRGYYPLMPKDNLDLMTRCQRNGCFPNNWALAFDRKFYKGVSFEQGMKIFAMLLFKKL